MTSALRVRVDFATRVAHVVDFPMRAATPDEMLAVLEWARERDISRASFGGGGPAHLVACRSCGSPVPSIGRDLQPAECRLCLEVEKLELVGPQARSRVWSRQECERLAQVADNVGTRLIEIAIELQRFAASAGEAEAVTVAEVGESAVVPAVVPYVGVRARHRAEPECTCGASFRGGEDYRDHLPCDGPRR